MNKPTILMADNVPSHIAPYAQVLELHGYVVKTANSFDEAERMLGEGLTHLAILDLRLRDDKDEKDLSGMELAKHCNPHIPKIILTSYPTWEVARDGFIHLDPHAIFIASKLEGLDALIEYVKHAFDRYVCINFSLNLEWQEDPYALVRHHEPHLVEDRLPQHANEFEDLLRRLLADYEQVRVGKVLWQRNGRIALPVIAHTKDDLRRSLLVIYGGHEAIRAEAKSYGEYAPKPVNLLRTSETTHFAANAYVLPEGDGEAALSLRELYRTDANNGFRTVITQLFDQTLAEWSHGQSVLEEQASLDELYRGRLALHAPLFDQVGLAERLVKLMRKLPTIGWKVESLGREIEWHSRGAFFSHADPAPLVFRRTSIGQPVLLANAPSALHSDGILTMQEELICLTDFADAGLAPLAWSHTSLEAEIRYDWLEAADLREVREMERCLTQGDFTGFEPNECKQTLRRAARAIQHLRLNAVDKSGHDDRAYQLGVFFQAMARLAHAPLPERPSPRELQRLAHLLLSASILAEKLSGTEAMVASKRVDAGIQVRIDEARRDVYLDGSRVHLTDKEFKLFGLLYERAGRPCTIKEIAERLYGHQPDVEFKGQEARVHQAVSRLVKTLEPVLQKRSLINNERGAGYSMSPSA